MTAAERTSAAGEHGVALLASRSFPASRISMAGPQLDGAGTAKMNTLDDAVTQLQHLHTIVERMASAVKNGQPTGGFGPQLRRTGGPMVGMLKAQFGMISDQVSALLLASTRGNNEQVRVRTLREGIGQLRQLLDIAAGQVKNKHAVKDEKPLRPD